MNNRITLSQIIKRLTENNLRYSLFELDGGRRLLVMEKSGRLFGPFTADDNSESMLWCSDVFSNAELFRSFLSEKQWNFGGDRLWVAPEFPFFIKDRQDFFDSYTVQPGIDPASYAMTTDAYGNLRLETDMEAEMFECEYDKKTLHFSKTLRKNANPLRHLSRCSELMDGVCYFGYEQEMTMVDTSPEKPMELEIWSLTQVNHGGSIFIPCNGECEYVDYYTPITSERLRIHDGYAELSIDGTLDHKVSFKSTNTIGRAAYINRFDEENYYMLVRNYYNDPSADYIGEPWDKPGETGCSLHVYIDGGGMGGFAEFENSGKTFGGKTGRAQSTDTVNCWYYVGAREKLEAIASVLLGIKL